MNLQSFARELSLIKQASHWPEVGFPNEPPYTDPDFKRNSAAYGSLIKDLALAIPAGMLGAGTGYLLSELVRRKMPGLMTAEGLAGTAARTLGPMAGAASGMLYESGMRDLYRRSALKAIAQERAKREASGRKRVSTEL